jgi:hypothetical protein
LDRRDIVVVKESDQMVARWAGGSAHRAMADLIFPQARRPFRYWNVLFEIVLVKGGGVFGVLYITTSWAIAILREW